MGSCCGLNQKNQSQTTTAQSKNERTYAVALQNRKKCKNLACRQDHQIHYCRVCFLQDVDHFASGCPKGTKVYHGTRKQYATQIMEGQFKITTGGRLGDGVYFALNFNDAKNISTHNRQNRPEVVDPVIIQCIVKLDEPDIKSGSHPAWAGNDVFPEICVPNPKRVKAIKIHNA